MTIKNEHLVWAYGEREDGQGQVLIIGLTDDGLTFLKTGWRDKNTLLVNLPGRGLSNVTQVVLFHEKDKATLKQRLRESGLQVSEAH